MRARPLPGRQALVLTPTAPLLRKGHTLPAWEEAWEGAAGQTRLCTGNNKKMPTTGPWSTGTKASAQTTDHTHWAPSSHRGVTRHRWGAPRPGHAGHRARGAGAGYLVGAVQRADEEGDLLHHGQVLLQVLKLLEEARGPEVHLIWAERDPVGGEGTNRNPSRHSLPGLPGGSAAESPPASAGDPGGSSVRGDPTSRGTTEPMRHSSRAHAPQEKPLQ